MNWNLIAKYASGGAVLGSVFALAWIGKIDTQVYVGLASAALTGLGINVVNPTKPPTQPGA